MFEFTIEESHRLQELIDTAINHANMGSRTAFKALLAIKPRVDVALDKYSKEALKSNINKYPKDGCVQ